MSTVDLIILGMALKAPSSAYDIQKGVEFRHLSHWVRVSTPSIYKKVLRLAEQGYLHAQTAREGKRAEKAVYTVTPAGRAYFEELMCKTARQSVRILFNFNAVVANLNKLEPTAALGLIGDIRAGIEETRDFTAQMAAAREQIPLVGRAVLRQQYAVALALDEWAREFEQQFRGEAFHGGQGG